MFSRLWRRYILDTVRRRLWFDGAWYPVHRAGEGYVCDGLSFEQAFTVSMVDLPKSLQLEVRVPRELIYAPAFLLVERGWCGCVSTHLGVACRTHLGETNS